mmetsp:Transcript_6562/g.7139  ORF Transcript_6562/g.7139 Transcript_6562/m.7139 type:complete len:98 (-) Transcript_6562:57-350(-)
MLKDRNFLHNIITTFILFVIALQKGLEWNDLKSIISIQSFNVGATNILTNFYPFIQAAVIDGMNLKTLYRLAIYNPKLIYELVPFETKAPKKRTQNV